MNPLLLSPFLAISMSVAAMFSTPQVALPTASPETADPRALLTKEFGRLEALWAQLQTAQREAEFATPDAATPAHVPAHAAPAPARLVPSGPRATMLATVRLQSASGVDSAARGLTPESAWRAAFPRKNSR